MNIREFVEEVFEIAFGDDAINRDFTAEEVLEELRDNSDRAWGINMDSSDMWINRPMRKFSPPQENDDE